ncbi:MAG TPA: hypothetical protein VGB83_01420 [Actinomycetota bacterium]
MRNADIAPGEIVVAINAFGERHPRRALTGIESEGHDFPVVWLCSEEEWQDALREGRDPEGIPWPAEDVSLDEGAA